MKLFDCDWAAMVVEAPAWDALPVPCKHLFLTHVEPNRPLAISRITTDFQPLIEVGFLEFAANPTQIRMPPECAEFRRVVRAMGRYPLFNPGSGKTGDLVAYLEGHFTHEERRNLLGAVEHWGDATDRLAAEASQVGWINRFLDEKDYRQWTVPCPEGGRRQLIADAATFDLAQMILKLLAKEKKVMSFPELDRALGAPDPTLLGPALGALIDGVLAFPALLAPDMNMVIGLWPGIHRRLHRQALSAPACVEPAKTFVNAFMMHDMTLLLVACSAEPLRVRKTDLSLFSKLALELSTRLSSLPEWFTQRLHYTREERLVIAKQALIRLRLAGISWDSDGEPSMGVTERGTQWLKGSDGERLKFILDDLRADLKERFDPDRDCACPEESRLLFVNPENGFRYDRKEVDHRPALVQSFAGLPMNGHVDLPAYLAFQANENNPLIVQLGQGRKITRARDWGGAAGLAEEALALEWRSLMDEVIVNRLVTLGGAAIGVTADGVVTIGLTSAGRYLLGLADDFEFDSAAPQDIIVQPNMEIVFLAPSPSAEATAARFAERVGQGVGVLFRITKRSIQDAFATGWDGDTVLARLGELSRKPIADNVTRQIRDWAAQCRKVDVATAVLFRCADHETALRVLAAGGKPLALIADTVVALYETTERKAIEKKLRQQGITFA